MGDAISQPTFDLEKGYSSKSSLFFGKKSFRILLPKALNPRLLWFSGFSYFAQKWSREGKEINGKESLPILPFSIACLTGALISVKKAIKME